MSQSIAVDEDKSFCEFRRKARQSELLSASVERLLKDTRFNGRISVVVKNGTPVKAGYEEFEGRSQEAAT